ncbi:amidase domain-containing protein [Clostridium sp. Sa3CUN1]|uniref:Amidase domain-containing protein n=1 Tax=Clostridium gallinarum TaxID=2762246 RepID=A0ABR8Q1Z5_9CLOT|nr:amidase domain-containing protein [Clostridium gallinarum]MBD7914438.1 amidase domain-containing protein [Clostridium gallinarum]
MKNLFKIKLKLIILLIFIMCTLLINIKVSKAKSINDGIKINNENINYSREKAREYAIKWAINPNKEYYNYVNDGGDCTNFVSQVLRAGGMEFIGSKNSATNINSWFYYSSNLPNRTVTWTAAKAFNSHFGKELKRVYKYREFKIEDALIKWEEIYNSIYIGDIVQYSRPNNIAFHSQAITDLLDKKTIYFSQHSNSMENFYKDGNLKYYLLGKPDDYNFLIYNIKKENNINSSRETVILTEDDYRKELVEAIDMIRISIEDTRFDNKIYKSSDTEKFIYDMEKKLDKVEYERYSRSKSSKELLEYLMDRSDL